MGTRHAPEAGFSLTELVMAVLIFSIVSMIMYSTFEIISEKVSLLSADNSLAEKGQRILSYLEEDIRMTGFLLGPDAQIPYCPGADDGTGDHLPPTSQVLFHIRGNPYDSLTLVTSIPIALSEELDCKKLFIPGDAGAQKDCASGTPSGTSGNRIDYDLTTRCDSPSGGFSVAVDAGAKCYTGLSPEGGHGMNGRSLVTFDSLSLSSSPVAGSFSQLYYTLASAGSTLTFREPLQQSIPDGSTVYGLRMHRYAVVGRSLRRIGWDKECACDESVTSDLAVGGEGAGGSGGVDALKFDFTTLEPISNTLATRGYLSSLSGLQTVTVWLLLRSDKASRGHTDTATYTLGSTEEKITVGPFNDHYRRLLLRKTVEVKNLGSIN